MCSCCCQWSSWSICTLSYANCPLCVCVLWMRNKWNLSERVYPIDETWRRRRRRRINTTLLLLLLVRLLICVAREKSELKLCDWLFDLIHLWLGSTGSTTSKLVELCVWRKKKWMLLAGEWEKRVDRWQLHWQIAGSSSSTIVKLCPLLTQNLLQQTACRRTQLFKVV